MILKHVNDIQWLEFELLADLPIVHGSFTRHGGHSKEAFASLNIGTKGGDDLDNVLKNIKKVSDTLNMSDVVALKICHGATISSISHPLPNPLPISDGISTQIPNLGLMVTQADCQAAIFYDPLNHAMANVHCGWRGNVQNIYQVTVSHMHQVYGSNPKDLLVCISPSLGPESSEFVNYRQELPETFWRFQVKPFYFDLWAISEWQLQQAGVLPHHIQMARIDTFAHPKDYFSYRYSKTCGRQITICSLKVAKTQRCKETKEKQDRHAG